jgi:Ca2+/Na+ antiporter
MYGLYVYWVWEGEGASQKHLKLNKQKVAHHHFKTYRDWMLWGLTLLVSLSVMVLSSKWLIDISLGIAESFGVNSFWVGLLMISFETTLPEVLSLAASRRNVSLLWGISWEV